MTSNPYTRSLIKWRYQLAGAALAVLMCASSAQAATSQLPPPGLSVQAHSFVEVEPDKASLSARLWENTPAVSSLEESGQGTLAEARERLEERSRQLISAMEDAGLDSRAISAGSLNVYQEQMHQPQGQTSGEQELMVRTRVERPFNVELSDLDRLDEVLDALVEAGVNALDGVQFDLQDREAATNEAVVMALEKAQRKAELMAQTLNTELGDVRHITETQAPVFQPRMMAMQAEGRSSDEPAAEYRPGIIRIDAGVSVEWSLAGQSATEPGAQDRPDTAATAAEQ